MNFGKLLGTRARIAVAPSLGAMVAEQGRAVAPRGGALLGGGLAGGRRRFKRPDNQLGIWRARDGVELQVVAFAVAVRPGGADFKPSTLRCAFLLDNDRVHSMRWAVGVGFGRHDQFFRY